mgnify:CR=1 FL=1
MEYKQGYNRKIVGDLYDFSIEELMINNNGKGAMIED